MGKKIVTFTLGEVAHRISETVGRDVDKDWCSKRLREIDKPINSSYSRNKRFTSEQCTLLAAYAQAHYHKKNAPSFTQWLEAHGHGIPKSFSPPVKLPATKEQKGEVFSRRDVERMVKDAVKRELEKHTKPVKMIEDSDTSGRQPNREKRLASLHKKVNAFVFNHKIEINETWKWLVELFQKRNNLEVRRAVNQSFPQWLEGSNNLELMYEQIDSYLDYMEDHLNNGPELPL